MQAGEENEEAQGPIKIDLGAAAKVSAVAKYERKTEVSIDVPEDVTRAKAEALLDAISPFTESLGLVGDWIADTRQRLRVQRIEALSVIATKARKAIEQQNDRPKQIPIKALLPILDRASLEEPGDESLTTAWGALIASASLDYDPEVMAFSRILSELSPRECLVLERIFGNRHEWALGDRASGAMRKFFDSEGTIKPLILDAVLKGDTAIFEKLRAFVDQAMPIEFTIAVTKGTSARANWVDKSLKEPFYAENEAAYHLLIGAQRLLEVGGHGYSWRDGETPVGIDWVTLTDLGARFSARVIPRSC
jgi:hypothetical protein